MHIFIATPTAGGITTTDYARTLVNATLAIHESGGGYQHLIVDGAEVALARNILANTFLQTPECDAILFIDSDMAVEKKVFKHFLAQEHSIVGAAYSERRIDLEIFAKAMQEKNDIERARALASKYNVRITAGEKNIVDHLCPVIGIGFGCVLIKREVFHDLAKHSLVDELISSRLKSSGVADKAYDFFGRIRLDSGEWLSEDYAFCDRYLKLPDAKIMAYVGAGVSHVGSFNYSAPYMKRLKEGLS